MRLFPLAALPLILLIGCGKSEPTLAGGKPVSHWVEELRTNPDAKVRKQAVEKLGNVGQSDPAAFPAVCAALKDVDPAIRSEAILALMKFGDTARDAIPTLTALREQDRDRKVRTYAGKALEKLQDGK